MHLIQQLNADFAYARGALRTLQRTKPIAQNPTRVFPAIFDELAARYGDAPALISDHERLSYRELAARANRYARWAQAQGLAKGDVVCLIMPNRPEYMAIWLGLTQAGAVVALINTNLTGASLAYCINVVEPKEIIVAAELLEHLDSARDRIDAKVKIWAHGENAANLPRVDQNLAQFSDAAAASRRAPRTHHRGPRALHLHLGHDRHAQGRQHQSLPADAGMLRLLRHHGHEANRPHVQLPAHVPHGRRRSGDRRGAGQRRLGVHPREILRARILERRRARGVHAVSVYRRALPLSGQHAADGSGDQAQAAACLRQRPASRCLARVQTALPHPAHPRILRRHRRQRDAVQLQRSRGLGRACPLVPGEPFPDQAGALRLCDRNAGARQVRPVHSLQARRGRRNARQDHARSEQTGRTLRGLCHRAGNQAQDPARRARARRHVVSHRRPDAPGSRRLFLFRRSHRRHVPLEGRERGDTRSLGNGHRHPRRGGGQCLRRRGSRHTTAVPAWRRW